eukprot:gene9074-11114_t
MIQVDPGSEFKGEVKKYFNDKNVIIRYGKVGRHRQQSLVESRNRIIGTVLFKRMTAEEILTGDVSRHWVKDLPELIKAMNSHYKRDVKKLKPISDKPLCSGDSCELLEEGTKVEKILDKKKIKGVIHYLVKWVGYNDEEDNTWEPRSTLLEDVPDIVNEYEKSLPVNRRTKVRRK